VDDAGLVESLIYVEGRDPQPVQTTVDPAAQQAAHAALEGVPQPAAVVGIDVASGEIRAAAFAPADGLDRALAVAYPPGSTFKIVTAAAALADGLAPEAPVDCPPTVTIGGRTLGNAGGYGPGAITFSEAFARSCNTAFARIAADRDDGELDAMAELFGFNAAYDPGLAAFGGSFPAPADLTERAAAAIGQARVESSTMHMASVAAAVASGTWRAPLLVRTGEPVEQRALPPEILEPLREMMRRVVAEGTGAAAALPGEPVAGKTGSAEFGTGPGPLPTHAWFAGYRGGMAVAVLVEGGGGGGAVAAPIAARFLAAMPAPEPAG
jgi:cell division protein FtsI/penicillin-binding protein 2